MALKQTKFMLPEDRIPRAWYNIAADLPVPPAPVLHPGTGQPVGPDDLAPLFPMALIGQEVSAEREIEIPEPVRQAYASYRPSPLLPRPSARGGARDPGAHLLQVRGRQPRRQPQAQHRHRAGVLQPAGAGVTRLATETGAGQWGSALSFAGALFGLEVKVYMVRASYDQKPYRRILMETYGARGRGQPVD